MGSQEPCIYRVPSQLREVKPEAYRPRMLLIGPLQHSAKPKAHKGNNDLRYQEYGMMEDHKRMYKAAFTKRPNAIAIIEQMTRIIKEEEDNIRASYAVSTAWILPYIFVELILNDSIFIAEFILRLYESLEKIGDLIVDNDFYSSMVIDDLKLLENQIPYFCLEKLLNPIIEIFFTDDPNLKKLDQVIFKLFSVDKHMKYNPVNPTKFNHFTDMMRCVYKKSLNENLELKEYSKTPILDMKNADKLSSVGVEFRGKMRAYSLKVSYEEGCLTLPFFQADEASNVILRNIIAYEQCHDPHNAFTTNYILFMNRLTTSTKDVEILTTSGVLTNGVGRSSMVLKTVNNLCTGVHISTYTQYHDVLKKLDTRYKSRTKKMWTTLRKVYFSDLWTATATLAAICLLLLTLGGTVAAIIQARGMQPNPTQSTNRKT